MSIILNVENVNNTKYKAFQLFITTLQLGEIY